MFQTSFLPFFFSIVLLPILKNRTSNPATCLLCTMKRRRASLSHLLRPVQCVSAGVFPRRFRVGERSQRVNIHYIALRKKLVENSYSFSFPWGCENPSMKGTFLQPEAVTRCLDWLCNISFQLMGTVSYSAPSCHFYSVRVKAKMMKCNFSLICHHSHRWNYQKLWRDSTSKVTVLKEKENDQSLVTAVGDSMIIPLYSV